MDTCVDTKGKESREVEAATGFEPVNNGFAELKMGISRSKQEKVTFNSFKHLAVVLLCIKKQKSAGKTR